MKRRALLIGYSGWDTQEGKLKGVSRDLINYKKYLLSLKGGAWLSDEITILEDTDISTLNLNLTKIRAEKNDIVFTVFSGHGEYDSIKRCRNICIDDKTPVPETILYNLAPRQIIILDSCSGEREAEKMANESYTEILLEAKHLDSKKIARAKYEEKCALCCKQELKFYAAERGTYASDTSDGGRYSVELLEVLNNTSRNLSIFAAHLEADNLIRANSNQKPDYDVPKLMNYLPGAIII